uniref:Uncharacterized protein n=1 Tax=Bracon brevicornis TaxID=1563983 RepID=A0A6V7L2L0_9HYME
MFFLCARKCEAPAAAANSTDHSGTVNLMITLVVPASISTGASPNGTSGGMSIISTNTTEGLIDASTTPSGSSDSEATTILSTSPEANTSEATTILSTTPEATTILSTTPEANTAETTAMEATTMKELGKATVVISQRIPLIISEN